MGEVVDLVSKTLSIAQAAQYTWGRLAEVHKLLGELPGRLAALSNEISDASMVLLNISEFLRENEDPDPKSPRRRSRGHIEMNLQIELQISRIKEILDELNKIITKIKASGLEASRTGSARRVMAWKRYHSRLNELQDDLVGAKAKLHLMLDTTAQ